MVIFTHEYLNRRLLVLTSILFYKNINFPLFIWIKWYVQLVLPVLILFAFVCVCVIKNIPQHLELYACFITRCYRHQSSESKQSLSSVTVKPTGHDFCKIDKLDITEEQFVKLKHFPTIIITHFRRGTNN